MSSTSTTHRFDQVAGALLALFVAALASQPVAAASTTIYKCFDRNFGVLFTDEPCSGEQMHIRAGDPDPVAVATLQRERDAILRSADQRISDHRRASLQREFAPPGAYIPQDDRDTTAYAPAYFPYGYGVDTYSPNQRFSASGRHFHNRPHHQRFVPAQPGRLLRR